MEFAEKMLALGAGYSVWLLQIHWRRSCLGFGRYMLGANRVGLHAWLLSSGYMLEQYARSLQCHSGGVRRR